MQKKTPLSNISHPRLSTTIINELKKRVFGWEYASGHRFIELELCKEFDVSRGPVREALRVLATEGILEHVPRRGFRVPMHEVSAIQELYDVRIALELFAVEVVTKMQLPHETLDDLARPFRSTVFSGKKTKEELARMDRGFHESLCSLAGNQTLLSYLNEINDKIHLFRIIDFTDTDTIAVTCTEHIKIIEAIKDRDVDMARKCMLKNIDRAHENVTDAIKNILMDSYMKTKIPFA